MREVEEDGTEKEQKGWESGTVRPLKVWLVSHYAIVKLNVESETTLEDTCPFKGKLDVQSNSHFA